MAAESLILVANPGSSSRKYALFKDGRQRVKIHFEYEKLQIKCHIFSAKRKETRVCQLDSMEKAVTLVEPILRELKLISESETINRVGLKIVAPGEFFLSHRRLDKEALNHLSDLETNKLPYIQELLSELKSIKKIFKSAEVTGVSDSAFHVNKPDIAWNYGIDIGLADSLGIKRYGYHGLSVSSVIKKLASDLPEKMVVCHLGSSASVTAVLKGKSIENSMGHTPLEGLIMATRSGNIDLSAAIAIKQELKLDDRGLETYLNQQAGLLGLSKQSDDIRYLRERYDAGDPLASLALRTYAYSVKKAIGQMVACLDGIDALVFTGTVGARSAFMRALIVNGLDSFGLKIDDKRNAKCYEPLLPSVINTRTRVKNILVVSADEETEIARITSRF